jgi:hypothetical protein
MLAPFGWRIMRDRQEVRALELCAFARFAVRRALGGDSLLAVNVRPATWFHAGQLLLSAPAGCDGLLSSVWKDLLRLVPQDYEVVVSPG